jgi:hypothetical protein
MLNNTNHFSLQASRSTAVFRIKRRGVCRRRQDVGVSRRISDKGGGVAEVKPHFPCHRGHREANGCVLLNPPAVTVTRSRRARNCENMAANEPGDRWARRLGMRLGLRRRVVWGLFLGLKLALTAGVLVSQPATPSPPSNSETPVLLMVAPRYEAAAWLRGGERFPLGAKIVVFDGRNARDLIPSFAATADPAVSFDGSVSTSATSSRLPASAAEDQSSFDASLNAHGEGCLR